MAKNVSIWWKNDTFEIKETEQTLSSLIVQITLGRGP